MTTETSNARGEWIREWQGSGPQRGFHIREATHLHNNRVVAYLGDQVDGEQVDKLIAEHNGCHANGDPIHDAPSAREWCEQNSVATTTEWRAGWDACRVEFPRIAAAPPPAAARGDVRGLVSEIRNLASEFTDEGGASETMLGWADRIESALAAEGVQAGDVEQRARENEDSLAWDAVRNDYQERAIARAEQPEARGVVDEMLSHADLCRLSRVFNAHNVPGLDQDRRINDWLGGRIAAALTGERNG